MSFNNTVQWCRRYLSISGILLIAAICYMAFFQDNSVARIYDNKRQIDSLETAIKANRDTMLVYRELNRRLDNRDPEIIERIVRENHDMNLPNEDVYIFD